MIVGDGQLADQHLPDRYDYVSKRLISEILDGKASTRRGRVPKLKNIEISTPDDLGIAAKASFEPPEDNLQRRVRLATQAIAPNTGSLYDFNKAYIRTKLSFQETRLTVAYDWENTNHHPIITYHASEYVPGVGQIWVGLIGSKSNLADGHSPNSGRTPSKASGLRRIIQEIREQSDPSIDPTRLSHEDDYSTRRHFAEAANLFHSAVGGFREPYEVLIDVFYPEQLITMNFPALAGERPHSRYDLALIGAPVWMSRLLVNEMTATGIRSYQDNSRHTWTAPPAIAADDPAGITRSGMYERRKLVQATIVPPLPPPGLFRDSTWDSFDSLLHNTCVKLQHRLWPEPSVPPLTEVQWLSYCRWFAEIAYRFAGARIPIAQHKYQRAWSRIGRQERTSDEYEASDKLGWIVRNFPPLEDGLYNQTRHTKWITVTMDGKVYPTDGAAHYRAKEELAHIGAADSFPFTYWMMLQAAFWCIQVPGTTRPDLRLWQPGSIEA